ncbi:putative WRKY transcription factor 32 [Panicum miliaceum]|uniref:WRKY transcription factor 32 n=1 Tax=Panicum miliaceum TaxID=4540 RepID=A0A3L6TCD9_PANMI|nr:putative WRKY transcription factor 32 [Panicum miliaceum]
MALSSAAHHHHLYSATNDHLPPLQHPDPTTAAAPLFTTSGDDPLASCRPAIPPHCNLQELLAATYPLSSSAMMTMPPVAVNSLVVSTPQSPSPTMTAVSSSTAAVDKGLLDDMVPPAMRHG